MLSVALRCFNDVFAGEEYKSFSCADVVYILVCTDKKQNRHNHHESLQFVIKSANGNRPPSPCVYEPYTLWGAELSLSVSAKDH